jgi:hypothetical protein
MRCWSLDKFEIAESLKVDREVLKGVGGLVDKENVENDIELGDGGDTFAVDRVGVACGLAMVLVSFRRPTCQLHDPAQLGHKVVVDLGSTGSTSDIQVELSFSSVS